VTPLTVHVPDDVAEMYVSAAAWAGVSVSAVVRDCLVMLHQAAVGNHHPAQRYLAQYLRARDADA